MIGIASSLWLLPPASAFCGSYVDSADTALYNHASEVVLVREDGQVTLTMANDQVGATDAFAMLVPVPIVLSEDQVRVVDPAVFDRIRAYAAPRLVSYTCDDLYPDAPARDAASGRAIWSCASSLLYMGDFGKDTGAMPESSSGSTRIEAQFIVGEYEIVILSAQESEGLLVWLNDQGYTTPAQTALLLQEYIDGGSYFFAAKVNPDLIPAGQEALSPLQLTYPAEVPSLPIRLGTANSTGEQDLVIYAINPLEEGRLGISNYTEATLPSTCMVRDAQDPDRFSDFYEAQLDEALPVAPGSLARWVVEYGWAVAATSVKCDPCPADVDASQPISNSDLATLGYAAPDLGDSGWGGVYRTPDFYFTRLHMRYTPAQATQDLSLYSSRITENTQQRYIVYEPYLEDRFPICGEGWAEDPGSCADVSREYGRRMRAEARAEQGCEGGQQASVLGLLLGLTTLIRRRHR